MKKISILSIITVSILISHSVKSVGPYEHRVGAVILNPLTVSHNKSLSFGTILASPSGGTVTVTAEDTVITSDVTLIDNSTAWAGEIEIHGSPSTPNLLSAVQIISTPPTQLVDQYDSSQTMALSNMQLHGVYTAADLISDTDRNLGLSGDEIGVALDSDGKATVKTTGTLTVGPNQASGVYTAYWTMEFIYPGSIYTEGLGGGVSYLSGGLWGHWNGNNF